MQYEEFIRKVADAAGISAEEAKRASIAVLQELCDRLSGKEADDLLAQLPARLRRKVIVPPCETPVSADKFVDLVADDLKIPPHEAQNRIRAVFATLRQAVSWGEFEDVLEELDPEYADLLA
jgi:uncharacterized protein (DUF2267 family)